MRWPSLEQIFTSYRDKRIERQLDQKGQENFCIPLMLLTSNLPWKLQTRKLDNRLKNWIVQGGKLPFHANFSSYKRVTWVVRPCFKTHLLRLLHPFETAHTRVGPGSADPCPTLVEALI